MWPEIPVLWGSAKTGDVFGVGLGRTLRPGLASGTGSTCSGVISGKKASATDEVLQIHMAPEQTAFTDVFLELIEVGVARAEGCT